VTTTREERAVQGVADLLVAYLRAMQIGSFAFHIIAVEENGTSRNQGHFAGICPAHVAQAYRELAGRIERGEVIT
jgi:hypothetical protein